MIHDYTHHDDARRVERTWWVAGTIVLVALLLVLGGILLVSLSNADQAQERLNQVRESLASTEEELAEIQAEVTELEGELNGLRVAEARAATCVRGLLDSVDAVDGAFGTEDWGTFYGRYEDVRRLCQQVLTGSFTITEVTA